MGTTTAQKKLFFNLKKIKNQIAPKTEGDLKDEDVKNIANRLDVSENEVVSMNRRLLGKEHSLNTPINETGDQWQDWLVDKEMDQELKFAQKEEMEQGKVIYIQIRHIKMSQIILIKIFTMSQVVYYQTIKLIIIIMRHFVQIQGKDQEVLQSKHAH